MATLDLGPATRPSLLDRLRDLHDADAWRTFVALYGPAVLGYCRRRGLQPADAADVTQEVLTRVAGAARDFAYDPDRGRFRDWLGTVARNEVTRFQSKEARRERAGGGSGAAGLLDALPGPERDGDWAAAVNAHVLRLALDRCRPHFAPAAWDAFRRVWLGGVPAPDAAREAGLPLKAVYVAKCRILKRLTAEVAALADDLPLVPTQ